MKGTVVYSNSLLLYWEKKLDSTSGNRGEKTPDVDVLINSLKRDTRLSRDVPLHQNSGTQQEMEKGQKIL